MARDDGTTLEFLGKYKILETLASGGMGVVYKGFDPAIERVVAIKTIHEYLLHGERGEMALARFKREAQAAGRLTHPNVVAIYDFDIHQDTPFIVMEFVEGRELGDFLRRGKPPKFDWTLKIIRQVLDALGYCHTHGIVHRDLKPPNIILLGDSVVKITDFGIARLGASELTQTGSVLGTPSYMSPEQFQGQDIDARSDLFAAGAILYELLTGNKAFPGKEIATIMHNVLVGNAEQPCNLNASLPKAFDDLLRKALAKKPQQRFQTAQEFAKALTLAAAGTFNDVAANNADTTVLVTDQGGRDSLQSTILADDEARSAGSRSGGAVPPRAPKYPWVAIAAVVVLSVGIAGWIVVGPLLKGSSSDGDAPTASRQEVAVSSEGKVIVQTEKLPNGDFYGVIEAQSEPVGAEFLVDGEAFGVTPLRFEIPPGQYKVVMRKEGYHPWSTPLSVEQSSQMKVTSRLAKVR